MKCKECNLWGADYYGDIPYCHADPNWPAPCEWEDDEPEEDLVPHFYITGATKHLHEDGEERKGRSPL